MVGIDFSIIMTIYQNIFSTGIPLCKEWFFIFCQIKVLIRRSPSFHFFQFCGFWVFLLLVWIFAPCFLLLQNVDIFNGRNIVFDSLVKLKWWVYCQKSRLYFLENNIVHGLANTIHWTFAVAFLVVKPTQLYTFEKTVCRKTDDKTGSELGSAAITPNHNFGERYCIDPIDLLDYFFQTCQGCYSVAIFVFTDYVNRVFL